MSQSQVVTVRVHRTEIPGLLGFPDGEPPSPHGIVLFAHGSGSSRFSPRNQFVATEFRKAGLATLLVDLLTEEEDQTREARFDIPLLAERLIALHTWLQADPQTSGLPFGIFGASTGSAAAFVAAAKLGKAVGAVVSRGGRPDLAQDFLGQVLCPSLLIVGEHDRSVLDLNRVALQALRCVKSLITIPKASHLFEEPGALPQVATASTRWFRQHLGPAFAPIKKAA